MPCPARHLTAGYETIHPDQVLVCSGAQEAIFLSLGVLLGPGDHLRLGFGRRDLPDALDGLRRFAAHHIGAEPGPAQIYPQ